MPGWRPATFGFSRLTFAEADYYHRFLNSLGNADQYFMKLSVVIPAYNEAPTIAELIRRVQAVGQNSTQADGGVLGHG